MVTILAHLGIIRPPKSATILGDTSIFHIGIPLFTNYACTGRYGGQHGSVKQLRYVTSRQVEGADMRQQRDWW